jgi:uncharacterized protein YbaR (Trm112 family)/ubiquinone/menaquinone biosynthesis C-methylase UbiE
MSYSQTLAVLNCPQCLAGRLTELSKELKCQSCAQSYPLISGIPWLLRDPQYQLDQWRARCQLLLKSQQVEEEKIKACISDKNVRESVRQRLSKMLQAKVEHRKELSHLFEPMNLNLNASIEREQIFRSSLPESMQLMGYYSNVFRDWAWDTGENQRALEIFREMANAKSLTGARVLTLGAGACRFPADIHAEFGPELSLACDINPYLLLTARKVIRGGSVNLTDFPFAPRDDQHLWTKYKLKSAQKYHDNLVVIAADALNFPAVPESFDLIMTPWFIDIINIDTELVSAKINSLLKPGGRWYNFGTLVFHQRNPAKNYTRAEVVELVRANGFNIDREDYFESDYLKCEASAQSRRERLWAFVATKTASVLPSSPIETWPQWLIKSELPLPRLPEIERTMMINASYNSIMTLVDGQRSLSEIGRLIGPQFHMSPDEAVSMLRQLLAKIYESATREQKF